MHISYPFILNCQNDKILYFKFRAIVLHELEVNVAPNLNCKISFFGFKAWTQSVDNFSNFETHKNQIQDSNKSKSGILEKTFWLTPNLNLSYNNDDDDTTIKNPPPPYSNQDSFTISWVFFPLQKWNSLLYIIIGLIIYRCFAFHQRYLRS